MVAAIAESRPERVLDVGCGTGDLTQRVRDEVGVELVAVDLSPRMVELTRARGIDARQADIQALPFVDDEFDCVVANRVLYHVPDLAGGVAEITRVLRMDGSVVAVTYSDDHLQELWDLMPPSAHPLLPFSAENGETVLRAQFAHVERRDVVGTARFASEEAVRGYFESYGEFATFSGADVDGCLCRITVPLDATYRHCVFVARSTPG